MGALFQVSLDASVKPGDLKHNIATLLRVPTMPHQELLRKETFNGFVYCRN